VDTHRSVLAAAAVAAIIPHVAAGQITCSQSPTLPAYSHNDYENSRPLHQALALGYRGVEVDLVLQKGELRAAHSGSESKGGRTLETMYLRPLRAILHQCGRVLNPTISLLLNLELKGRSRPAYDSLLAMLARYSDLFEERSPQGIAAVEIVLVGWSPAAHEARTAIERRLGSQYKITTLSSIAAPGLPESVRLVSLDYGKTIGWSGRGPVPQRAGTWLSRVRAVKGRSPRYLARAYNAPPSAAVYRLLLDGGIDLIGTEDLRATQRVIRQLGRVDFR
jgi:hypothetical protein